MPMRDLVQELQFFLVPEDNLRQPLPPEDAVFRLTIISSAMQDREGPSSLPVFILSGPDPPDHHVPSGA